MSGRVRAEAMGSAASATGGSSDAAEVLAQLVRSHDAVPDEAVADLRRLLGHDLARRNPARLRLGHLGLLIEMVSDARTEGWVSQSDYTRERAARAEQGEDFPDESTLRNAYGPWVAVLRAATRFVTHGGSGRVPSSYRHARPVRPPYTPEGIIDALLRCFIDLGQAWPTEWEYHEWAAIRRHLSAADPRLPGPKQIRKCFDSFADAQAAARGAYEASRADA